MVTFNQGHLSGHPQIKGRPEPSRNPSFQIPGRARVTNVQFSSYRAPTTRYCRAWRRAKSETILLRAAQPSGKKRGSSCSPTWVGSRHLTAKAPKPWSRDVTEKPWKRGGPQLGRRTNVPLPRALWAGVWTRQGGASCWYPVRCGVKSAHPLFCSESNGASLSWRGCSGHRIAPDLLSVVLD
jgi:hypothetical protein